MRDFVHKGHVVRHPPLGDLALHEGQDFILGDRLSLFRHDNQQRALVPLGMAHADHGGFGDLGVADGEIFNVDG